MFNGGMICNSRLNDILSGNYSDLGDNTFSKVISKDDFDHIKYVMERGKFVIANVKLQYSSTVSTMLIAHPNTIGFEDNVQNVYIFVGARMLIMVAYDGAGYSALLNIDTV